MWPHGHNAAGRRPGESEAGRQAAVIDIGSNSVRLVVYRVDGRALWTVFNEKALAGLGRDLSVTGRLSPQGVAVAITALRRFRAALDGWDHTDISVVATAAVRDADDGDAFLRRVQQETGFAVRLLSGAEEARFAALGVQAGQPTAEGVVGDLGGASLELVRLTGGTPAKGVTLPLGPFSLGAPKPLNAERTRRAIDVKLKGPAARFATRQFHAVGGAWRNLALLHMVMADYPLRIAHQYEMSRSDAMDVARFVARQSRSSLEGIEGLSRKRMETLPYAGLVLESLIDHLAIDRVVISAYGLREGLLLDSMDADVRRRDPLIEGCEALTAGRGLSQDLGPALQTWLEPVFSSLPPMFGDRDPVLMAAACRLADLGARLHPDHRATLVFDQVLRAPIAGMTHSERAFLASAAFARHSAAGSIPEPETVAKVLSVERRHRARALGSAIRLGCDLSGRNAALLARSDLAIDGDTLRLTAQSGWADMLLGEQTARRAGALAAALRLDLKLS